MNTYEQEVFDFFSKKENFENMLKVASHVEPMKKILLKEFWEKVIRQLQLLNKTKGEQWIIKFSENGNIFNSNTKLLLYKPSWQNGEPLPPLAIAVDRLTTNNFPYYGIWVNMKSTISDFKYIMSAAKLLKLKNGFEQGEDGEWWPIWNGLGINFSNEQDFIKLLPCSREALIESFVNTVFGLANELEVELDTIMDQGKKQFSPFN